MGDEVFAFVTKARFKVEHRERMQIRNPVITIALLLALCASSASYVKLNPKLDKKSVYDPLPLTIGFYKNPDFANRVETRALVYNQYSSYVFPLGKATLELFEQILATMFTKRHSGAFLYFVRKDEFLYRLPMARSRPFLHAIAPNGVVPIKPGLLTKVE